MKKSFVLAALAVAALVSCQKEMSPEEIIENGREGYVEVTLTATCDVTTKASLDGKAVIWEEGEKLAVYTDNSTASNIFTVKEVEGSNVVITGTVPEGATSFIAAYPYESAVSYSAGVLTMSVPAAQNVAEGEYVAPDALLSAAYFADAETPAQFRNVVSLLAFTVSDADVDSAEFGGGTTGGDNVITVELSADAEPVVTNVDGGFCVCVSAPEGFESGATYYATVPPTKAVSGFYATVRKSGRAAKRSSEKSFELVRNSGFNLGEIVADDAVYKFAQISNGTELKEFLEEAASYAADDVVEIVDDIDLSGMEIVTAKSFAGVLDGKLHSIKNWTSDGVSLFGTVSGEVRDLTLDASCTFEGVLPSGPFGYIAQSTTGKMENCHNKADVKLSISSDHPEGGDSGIAGRQFGTLSGNMPNHDAQLIDCSNSGSITIEVDITEKMQGTLYLGGLVGHVGSPGEKQVTRLLRCTNSGSILVNSSSTDSSQSWLSSHFIGGVAGGTGVNAGSASVTSGYTLYYGEIRNCSNSGSVSATWTGGSGGYFKVGGVIGVAEAGIFDCENTGDISYSNSYTTANATPSVGGVVAVLAGQAPVSADGCVNRGSISLSGMFGNSSNAYASGIAGCQMADAGGCFGVVGDNTKLIQNCSNYGKVTVDSRMAVTAGSTNTFGGVAGWSTASVKDCHNYGDVDFTTMSKEAHFGGVVGNCRADVVGCTNSGTVTASHDISALTTNHSNGINNAGGIVGYLADSAKELRGCENKGGINLNDKGCPEIRLGGVVGMNYVAVSDCKNSAAIVLKRENDTEGKSTYGAGVIGCHNIAKNIDGCVNTGTVDLDLGDANGTSYVGGVVGSPQKEKTDLNKCINEGDLVIYDGKSATQMGGITGRIVKSANYTSCRNSGTVRFRGAGSPRVAGICGYVNNLTNVTLTDCVNDGDVIFEDTKALESGYAYVGGCVGYFGTPTAGSVMTYDHCINNGDIKAELTYPSRQCRLGGIAGLCGGNAVHSEVFKNCENHGDVISNSTAGASNVLGGLVGYAEKLCVATCEGFVNTGKISGPDGESRVGGLFGNSGAENFLTSTFTDITISADTVVETGAGGIVGILVGNTVKFTGTFSGKAAGTVIKGGESVVLTADNYTEYLFGGALTTATVDVTFAQ